MPLEVTALDHIYVTVADIERSERFYDSVMKMLGFRKGTKPMTEPNIPFEADAVTRPRRFAVLSAAGAAQLKRLCARKVDEPYSIPRERI